MTWGQPLGLDELMIINPGRPDDESILFLGEDGTLYQLQPSEFRSQEPEELFLGDDGALYQLQGYIAIPPASLARSDLQCGCQIRSCF